MKFIDTIRILSLVLLICLGRKSFAQNESLRFEQVSIDEGLSNVFLTTIFQDSKGFIWFGTDDGLIKYDGYTFTKYRFDPFDPHSLSQNLIYTIWEDKLGSIWVGTYEGLCRFDRSTEKFTRYKPSSKAKFSDPNIFAINEDADGMMWIGSASGGLCRFDRQKGEFLPENFVVDLRPLAGNQGELHGQITCMYKDREGILWVGDRNGLHAINRGDIRPGQSPAVIITNYRNDPVNPTSLSGNIIGSIIEDKAGMIWVATDNGLNSFNKKTGIFKRYIHDPKDIHSITTNNLVSTESDWIGIMKEDRDGNLWIPSENGLVRFNKDRTIFSTYTHDPDNPYSLGTDIPNSVEIDKDGILWVASSNGIIQKANLNQKAFGLKRNDPKNSNSLSNNQVTSLLEDSSGVIWIGTASGGLNRWDRKSDQYTHYKHAPSNPKSLKYNEIRAMLEDRHGHLWICNGDALSLFNRQTGEFTHYNSNEGNYKDEARIIFSITEDRDGLIWLGTGNGLKNFDETSRRFNHYYHIPGNTNGISDYTAIAVFADSRDDIWVGFGSIATDRLNKQTSRFTHYKHNFNDTTSISSNIVKCFYEDSKGRLWLGTSAGGLCSFDFRTGKFTTRTDKYGLSDNSVFSIKEDNNGILWLGTGNGLSRFDPATNSFTNYDYKDGLQGNMFATGSRNLGASFKAKDGTLFFGGQNGLSFFNALQIKANSQLAPIVITQFKLFDRLVKGANESKEIVLDYDQNYFSFEFSSLSYYNPLKNQYTYKLEGFDKDWVYSGSRRYAAYTNINPGRYTFKVKGTNNDGVWNEQGTSIAIHILPPWWETWWAYAFYGLCLLVGIYFIDRIRRRIVIEKERTKARERELEQAKEIEKAYHQLRNTQAQLIQSEKMASLGELTAGIAHEIQNPLNFMNNFSEVNAELIDEMQQEMENGNLVDAKAIAKNIKDNEQKINHHGKRADSIVKGMLQHSRETTGQKEATDINALADEYLRLSYQGLRAKDKAFNATLKTHFDPGIGKINIIPQDFGRVLLNLYNNAFYAVSEKKKIQADHYEPTVSVITSKTDGKIEIRVKDNGNGIPVKVREKIFQPFFTTKPTGQGTGLGLSLSYDIVKAHGGEIEVETKEGEGVEFIIQLPV